MPDYSTKVEPEAPPIILPATPKVEVKRDRFGRPYITPLEGGKPVPYTRVTTVSDTLDDRYNLEQWKLRQLAIGLADRPDLLLQVTVQRDDRDALNATCETALEVAQSKARANTGLAIHKLTELLDLGLPLPSVPPATQADLDAYLECTSVLEVLAVEQMVVLDKEKVAGTFDRIVRYKGGCFVADLKTGLGVDYAMGSIAIQLALYARGVGYDPATGERSPLPDVDQNWALVIHLPAGTGTCRLVWVDIRLGWEAAQLASRVRAYRKYARNGLAHEISPATPVGDV